MKAFLSILLLLSSNYIFCQAPEIIWQKCLGGNRADFATSVHETSDKGIIVAGYSQSNDGDVSGNHGSNDYWVVKIENTGKIQWQKSLGGSGDDVPYSIRQTGDKGYIVAGYTNSYGGDVTDTIGGKDMWVVKLDQDGNIQWQKSYGGSGDDIGTSIQQTNDGGYIIGGITNSTDGDVKPNHGGYDCWLVKISSTGKMEWQKGLGGSGNEDLGAIQQTAEGGFVVAGSTSSNDGDVRDNHSSNKDAWIVKLSSTGVIEWANSLGGTDEDMASSIRQSIDGGYIFSGSTYSNDGDVSGKHESINQTKTNDIWVVKLNSIGILKWQKCLGGTYRDIGSNIQQTADGGYIVSGTTQSYDGDVSGYHGQGDFWTVKLSSSGSIEWQKCLGGTSSETASEMWETRDGNIIIAGVTNSTDGDVSGNHGLGDFWVAILNAGVLPIHLISFSGNIQNHTAKLNWQSATEDNFKEFIIEKSMDVSSFSSIATVNAKGSNSNYIFSTPQKEAVAYYRLRMVDKDGQFSYSSIIVLKQNARAISLHPNPARDFINVTATTGCQAAIYNATGVLIEKIRLKEGENKINISRFSGGIYFIITEDKERLPFMKQ